MNILYVSEYFYPRLAGGEIVSWQYCAGLADRGHKIYVITSLLQDTAAYEVVEGVEISRPLQSASISGTDSILGIGALFKRAAFAIKLYPVLQRFIRLHKIDLIYNVAYGPTLTTSLIASGLGIPVITAVHSIMGTTWFKLTNPILALFMYLTEILVVRLGKHDVIQCPSNYAAGWVRLHTGSKIAVIPPPLDMQEIIRVKGTTDIRLVRQQLGIQEAQRFLLFVGSLTPIKNVYRLVIALSGSKSDFKLVLVGEGPERHKIDAAIQKLNIAHNVLLLGQRSHVDTLRLINCCDVLLMPSKIETFGIVVLEALAMDRIVIATPVGCVTEISSNNVFVIHNLNEISKLIESPFVSRTGHTAIEEFSLSSVIGCLEQLCETTISNKRKPAANRLKVNTRR